MRKNYMELEYNCAVNGLRCVKILRITLFCERNDGPTTPRIINDNFVLVDTRNPKRRHTHTPLLVAKAQKRLYIQISPIYFTYVCH